MWSGRQKIDQPSIFLFSWTISRHFRQVISLWCGLGRRSSIGLAGELTDENVCFVIAGREFDAFGGGSGFEEGLDGFDGAAAAPVRIDRGFDGKLEGGAVFGVASVDGGSAGDEELYGFGPRSPCGHVEGGAVCGDVEVGIAGVARGDGDAEIEEVADAFGVGVSGELGEESSTLGDEFGDEVGFVCGERADGSGFVLGAGGDEAVDSGKVQGDVAAFEFVEDPTSAAVDGDVDGGGAFARAFEEGICSVIEKKLDDDEAVIAAERLVECGESPVGHVVWVGAVFECEFDASFVVPVGFAEENGVEACVVEPTAVEHNLEDGVVVGFDDVVRGLFVVGVGSAVEKKLGEARVLGEGGGSVDDRLEGGARGGVVDHLVPASVGAGSGIEEDAGGANEGFRTLLVEPEIAGEAEVSQSVPVSRAAGGDGVLGALSE